MQILLVEDDIDLNETIKDFLESFYEIIPIFDGEEAINEAYEKNYDLIILDVKLPKVDGFSVAKEIRCFKDTPIIFLTSLDTQKDIEKGFLSGADDYIKKPFSLKELKYRIDAIFRRIYGGSDIVTMGNNFKFDLNRLELYKNNQIIHLKPKVAKLLKLFIQNKNKTLSKELIFDYLYELDEPNEQSLRTFINTLRHIFGKNSITTTKGIGYRFNV